MGKEWSRYVHLTLVGLLVWVGSTQSAWSFSDTGDRWNSQCISRLSERGFVSGYPDGTFRPNNTVTRTEFAVLMLNIFPYFSRKRVPATFTDVDRNYWGYSAIQGASARQFFTGYPDGTFRPQQPIPRVQATLVVANALSLISPDNPNEFLQQSFEDSDRIPDYGKIGVAAATLGGLVVNYPNVKQLRPNDNATRGEIAALLCRVLGYDETLEDRYVVRGQWRLAFPPSRGGFREFREGLSPYYWEGKYGYLNRNGDRVIPHQFVSADLFDEGLAAVSIPNEEVLRSRETDFEGNAIPAENEELWGYIDREGNWVIQPQLHEARRFSEGLAVVKIDGRYGYINPNGEMAIEPQYQMAQSFSEGLAPVLTETGWQFIDPKGTIVTTIDFSGTIYPLVDGMAKIETGNQVGYINREGEVVIEPQFSRWTTGSFSEGLLPVFLENAWGFIDRQGEVAIAPNYQMAGSFSEGLAPVKIDEKWGFINNRGEMVISPQFYAPVGAPPENNPDVRIFPANITVARPFSEGLAAVQVGQKAGFIDREGNFVIPPLFTEVESFSDGLARVKLGGTWALEGGNFVPQVMVFEDYRTVPEGGTWVYIRHPQP
ncbi:MAG: hypothetical protein D6680_00865 [Cyanobacteria bacterium J007]|nr:MAG: hypothetical protein D6680_00865 [Cyanobacteria bacterium J007]